jgi:hypothetical protein
MGEIKSPEKYMENPVKCQVCGTWWDRNPHPNGGYPNSCPQCFPVRDHSGYAAVRKQQYDFFRYGGARR